MAIDPRHDIYGSSQNDVLNGGADNERMFGGAGDDTMDGGAGSDWLNAASGDDLLVYNLSANAASGTADTYLGGSGKDTLWLQFTRAEWLTHQVQSQLSAYLAHLAAVTNAITGEVSSGSASDFVFTFGAASLTVQMVENVRVSVDGVDLTAANDLVTALADAGSLQEDGPAVDISVLANDAVPDLVATLALATGPAHGTATLLQPDAGDPSTWYFRYQASAADFQYLAEGQQATDSFTYAVTDADGNSGTATVTITITGTNDGPVVASQDVTGAVDEMGSPSGDLTDSGAIAFTDVDLTDVHSVGAVSASAGALGTLAASVSSDSTGSGTGGVVTWNYSVAAAAAEYLAAGETKTETFSFELSDGHGGTVTRSVSVTLTGTNDAPVITNSVTALVGAVQEDQQLTATGQLAATDVDDGATQAWSVQGSPTGTYGSIGVDASGKWTYTLDNAAHQDLAQGESHDENFTIRVTDDQGAFVDQAVKVTVTGTNDAPVITGGATTGSVTEDAAVKEVTGRLAAVDPDHGARDAWSAQGGVPSGSADFHFAMDSLTITRNGSTLFQDDFSDGTPPPVGPNGSSTSYITFASPQLTETGGRLVFDGANAVPFVGVGSPDPIVGEDLLVRMNVDPANTTDGLKSNMDFTVTGVFDLLLPDRPRESFGIRLTDRVVGGNGTPPDQLGDSVLELRIAEATDGTVRAVLRKTDFVHNTVTNLQAIPLNAPAGADQIRLNLSHEAASAGVVHGWFEYLQGGTVVGSQAFSATGLIFQGENWTRVEVLAAAPATNDAVLGGTYGSLVIDQSGKWTYDLDNSKAATQALAAGQHGTDTLTVKVQDEFGASDSRTISIDVVGSNDAPLLQTSAAVTRTLAEDTNLTAGKLTATGETQFTDVDLADTHAVSTTLASAQLSSGDALPAGLADALQAALGATLIDEATGDAQGGYRWNFALDNAATQFLGAGQSLVLTYNLAVADNHGASATQQVTLTINGTNDAPVITNDAAALAGAVQEDQQLTATGQLGASDVDRGATQAWSVQGSPTGTYGSIGVDASGKWTYTLDNAAHQDLAQGELHDESFTIRVTDDQGAFVDQTVKVTVAGSNDPAAITGTAAGTVKEDGTLVTGGTLSVGDVDHGDAAFGAVGPLVGTYGQFTFAGGAWTYALDNALGTVQALGVGETVHDTLTVQSKDGSASREIDVAIAGTNDLPVIGPDVLATSEDGTLTVAVSELLANDYDVEDDALGVVALDLTGTAGAVRLDGSTISYTAGSAFQYLRPGEAATDTFQYAASDDHGGVSKGTVTVSIAGANDAPTAGDDSAFVYAGSSVTLPVLANDSDPEDDPLTIAGFSAPAHGTALVHADGTITYTPTAGYAGTDSFTYAVKDASGAVDSGTVSLVVGYSDHDRIGGDVFLQGNYMEIGVSSAGSLGTANGAPANYHPMDPAGVRRISYVVDGDGWGTGAGPAAGDFTLPGSPVDTIVLGVNGASYVQDQRSGRNDIPATTVDVSAGSVLAAKTIGTAAGVQMTQLIELDAGATYYRTTITVTNLGGSMASDVRFLRSFDPDQDIYRFGTFLTYNDVLANPTTGSDIAISRATGIYSGVSVNLVAFDADARVSNYGFANYDAYSPYVWSLPQDRNGAMVDEAITLELRFGNLAVGQQVTKVFYTSLNGSQTANDMSIGTPGNDFLNPGSGNDLLIGLAGNDTLVGGAGNDRFVFSRGSGADVISDFVAGASTDDTIELRGFGWTGLADVRAHATQVGADLVIDLGAGDSIKLLGVSAATLHADDFQFA